MAKESALDRIKKLDEERKSILEEAKAEAMKKVDEGLAELKALGFKYRLVADSDVYDMSTKRRNSKPPPRSLISLCPICQFTTVPPHDGRQHRSQGDNKKPFNDSELKELGLTLAP